MQAGSHKTNGIRKEDVAFMMDPAFLFGSFKNSVGERKTETRKKQMSSRKGTHF